MAASAEKAARAVFAKILKEIKPSNKELQESVYNINQITTRLKKIVPKDVEIRVVGSVVRGTQLRGDSDVDIFLLFSKKHSREKITKDGLAYAKKIVTDKMDRYEIKYAEHPYARLYLNSLGTEADIVPAFNIDNIEDMGTAVDRSPMHANFINRHLGEKQRDDVRLMKYLLARNELYGAEVKTGGFSGYLCELLVYHYGSLSELIENGAVLTMPTVLDPKTRSALHDPALIKKFNSTFIVIDPVDPNRNVAAGLSTETLAKFILLCRRFLARPSSDFFFRGGFPSGKVKGLLNDFLEGSGLEMHVLAVKIPDKSEDITWPQLRKVSEFVIDYCEKFGFKVYLSIPIIAGRTGLLAFFAPRVRMRTRLSRGPSVFIKKAQEEFLDAHKHAMGIVVKGDLLFALERNKYETLGDAMKDIAAGKVMGRHKDIKLQGAKFFLNDLPQEYAETVYAELYRKIHS